MIVVPFKAQHFQSIELQDAQLRLRGAFSDEVLCAAEMLPSNTVLINDTVIAIFGVWEKAVDVAIIWVILSKYAGKHMVALTKGARKFLAQLPYKRIEADVDCEFMQGHRWAKMTGFALETERVRAGRLDGGYSAIYARAG